MIPWRLKQEIADYYRCDLRTITNLMRRRILPFVKIGRIVRFNIKECDRAMNKYKRPSMLLQRDSGAGNKKSVNGLWLMCLLHLQLRAPSFFGNQK